MKYQLKTNVPSETKITNDTKIVLSPQKIIEEEIKNMRMQ